MFLLDFPYAIRVPETHRAALRSEQYSWQARIRDKWLCCWCLTEGLLAVFTLPFPLWGHKFKALLPHPAANEC